MRRRALVLALFMGLLLATAAPAPARAAQLGTPVACAGHTLVASYTTGSNNTYQMFAHNCVDDLVGEYKARTHWHCYRNGASWDGCRVNARLIVQFFSGGSWQDSSATIQDVSNPGGGSTCTADSTDNNLGFFSDSSTSVSLANDFVGGTLIRGAAKDPDNMRFCLADGSTVLRDVTNSVSGTVTAQ